MFGLKDEKPKMFEFDLEKELKKDKKKTLDLQKHVDARVFEIKAALREGAKSSELDQYGELLQGYVALHKVLVRISKR